MIVPDTVPVEDKEENAFCLISQNLKAVKIENMDLDNLSSATLFCFSLTLSSNTRCLLVSISRNILSKLHIYIQLTDIWLKMCMIFAGVNLSSNLDE